MEKLEFGSSRADAEFGEQEFQRGAFGCGQEAGLKGRDHTNQAEHNVNNGDFRSQQNGNELAELVSKPSELNAISSLQDSDVFGQTNPTTQLNNNGNSAALKH